MELNNIENLAYEVYNNAGKINSKIGYHKNPQELMGILLAVITMNSKIDLLLKKDFYAMTNDTLKKKLKEDFDVSEDELKELKNKKDLVNKIMEVM